MRTIPAPVLAAPQTLTPTRGMTRSEADIIAARIASHRRWERRRRTLRLRAALFGRRKQARVDAARAPLRTARARPANAV